MVADGGSLRVPALAREGDGWGGMGHADGGVVLDVRSLLREGQNVVVGGGGVVDSEKARFPGKGRALGGRS